MNPEKRAIPVVSIVGRSSTGKTTLIERLIPILRGMGLKVATIKHMHHGFEMDIPGKDTYRHKAAGAEIVVISSPKRIALMEDLRDELGLEEVIDRYIKDADIVVTEGYKKEDVPKIEVYKADNGIEPLWKDDRSIIAIVADRPIDLPVPVFLRDDIVGVADFIVRRLNIRQ
jgi:molybdopterin-guanine dinucleotide biosynthesis protein B